jgi:hypothetical protein
LKPIAFNVPARLKLNDVRQGKVIATKIIGAGELIKRKIKISIFVVLA